MTHLSQNTLSQEQRYALQEFNEGHNLFITGPGGTGKTHLIHILVKNAETRNKIIQVCALTGCASILLGCNARTIHSWSGIRNGKGEIDKIIEDIRRNKKIMKNWREIQILVIDEVSMMSKRIFELLDEIGRNVRHCQHKPFGGIQIVFTGDFYQLPPVGNHTEPGSTEFCFESLLWKETFLEDNHIELRTMFRQKDPIFQSILLNVRKGTIEPDQIVLLQNHVNREYNPEEHNGVIPTKLFPTIARVDSYNRMMFDQIQEISYDYDAQIKTNCTTFLESGRVIAKEDLERCKKITKTVQEREIEYLKNNTPCVDILSLKKGAVVMSTVNLDIENGICNGSTGIVIDFQTRIGSIPVPIVKFANGIQKTMEIQYWQSEEYPSIAVGNFPLRLAWAMTIHKSQGATLSLAEIDIGKNIFEKGQSYVALSRVQSLDGLYLSDFNPKNIRANPKVTAFYDEIQEVEYDDEEEAEIEEEKKEEIHFEAFAYKEEEKPNTNKIIIF
jgi:ATP-dependent DNA helicase PIF1